MNTEPTSAKRSEPRIMLALIALATDLPVPEGIHLYDDSGILAVSLRNLSDGFAWVRFLDKEPTSYQNKNNNRRHIDYRGIIEWHGWHISISASDPVTPDSTLDNDTTARLNEIARSAA